MGIFDGRELNPVMKMKRDKSYYNHLIGGDFIRILNLREIANALILKKYNLYCFQIFNLNFIILFIGKRVNHK